MNRPIKLIIIIFLIVGCILGFLYYRYNLSYGETLFQKSMMFGCMTKTLENHGHSKSKSACECVFDKLFESYTEEKIDNDFDSIMKNNKNLFYKCSNIYQISEKLDKNDDTSNTDYAHLNFPDTIREEVINGNFKYYFEISDTVKTDKDDFRGMTLYTQLFKKNESIEVNKKKCDTFYARVRNFKDTLNCPIFFENKFKSGRYYLKGEVLIRSIPAYYGKKDSLNAKIFKRNFNFYKKVVVE